MLNQEANRPPSSGERQTIWTITLDHSEVRRLSIDSIATGDPLPWKIAMWGTPRDMRLLRTVERRFPTLKMFSKGRFDVSEGIHLRHFKKEKEKPKKKQEKLVKVPELSKKQRLIMSCLRGVSHVYTFPDKALEEVPKSQIYIRERGGKGPLKVFRKPHIIVSEARTFSVYSNEFLVVPKGQIGIAGKNDDSNLLQALAAYLSSSFFKYHQFLTSPRMEFRGVATKESLDSLPVPFGGADSELLRPWVELQRELADLSDRRWALLYGKDVVCADQELEDLQDTMTQLEREVDELTSQALGLHEHEKWLVEDFVNVRLSLIDGKIGEAAISQPDDRDLRLYGSALRDVLDEYLDRGERFRHAITVVHQQRAGIVQVDFQPSATPHEPTIEAADSTVGRAILAMRERIERDRSQWLYFDRNLMMYLDGKVFVCKPMQRIRWTRSQALADADQIIADLVAAGSAT